MATGNEEIVCLFLSSLASTTDHYIILKISTRLLFSLLGVKSPVWLFRHSFQISWLVILSSAIATCIYIQGHQMPALAFMWMPNQLFKVADIVKDSEEWHNMWKNCSLVSFWTGWQKEPMTGMWYFCSYKWHGTTAVELWKETISRIQTGTVYQLSTIFVWKEANKVTILSISIITSTTDKRLSQLNNPKEHVNSSINKKTWHSVVTIKQWIEILLLLITIVNTPLRVERCPKFILLNFNK